MVEHNDQTGKAGIDAELTDITYVEVVTVDGEEYSLGVDFVEYREPMEYNHGIEDGSIYIFVDGFYDAVDGSTMGDVLLSRFSDGMTWTEPWQLSWREVSADVPDADGFEDYPSRSTTVAEMEVIEG